MAGDLADLLGRWLSGVRAVSRTACAATPARSRRRGVAPGVGRDRPRRRPPQRRAAAARWRPPPRCARWSRPTPTATARCRWPAPPSRAAPPGWRWPSSRRGWRCATPASTRPCSCCRSRPPDAMADVVAHGLTPTLYTRRRRRAPRPRPRPRAGVVTDVHVKVDTGMHRVGRRPRRAGATSCGAVAAEPVAPLRRAVDPLPGGRRGRATRTGPSPRPRSARLADARGRAGRRRARARRWCTPPTRPGASPTPAPASTWCAAGSPSTGSSPFPVVDPVLADGAGRHRGGGRCARCCRCAAR